MTGCGDAAAARFVFWLKDSRYPPVDSPDTCLVNSVDAVWGACQPCGLSYNDILFEKKPDRGCAWRIKGNWVGIPDKAVTVCGDVVFASQITCPRSSRVEGLLEAAGFR